jgi:hypothetical protein
LFSLFKSKKNKEAEFWAWVLKHIDEITKIESGHDPIYQQANEELKKYHRELVLEVCGNRLIISADGMKRFFPNVEKLVAAAPESDDFEVVAFRQAQGFSAINYNGVDISPDDIYFDYKVVKDQLDVNIYHKDYSEENRNLIGGAIFIILDHGIGEYLVETKLGHIEFKRFNQQENLQPISNIEPLIQKLSL